MACGRPHRRRRERNGQDPEAGTVEGLAVAGAGEAGPPQHLLRRQRDRPGEGSRLATQVVRRRAFRRNRTYRPSGASVKPTLRIKIVSGFLVAALAAVAVGSRRQPPRHDDARQRRTVRTREPAARRQGQRHPGFAPDGRGLRQRPADLRAQRLAAHADGRRVEGDHELAGRARPRPSLPRRTRAPHQARAVPQRARRAREQPVRPESAGARPERAGAEAREHDRVAAGPDHDRPDGRRPPAADHEGSGRGARPTTADARHQIQVLLWVVVAVGLGIVLFGVWLSGTSRAPGHGRPRRSSSASPRATSLRASRTVATTRSARWRRR